MLSPFTRLILRMLSAGGGALLVLGLAMLLTGSAGGSAYALVVASGSVLSLVSLVALSLESIGLARRYRAAGEAAARLSQGELYEEAADDEVRESLAAVSHYLKEKARVANRIADGDLGAAASLGSETDVLGRAFRQMAERLGSSVQTREGRDRLERSVIKLLGEVSEVSKGDLTVTAEVGPEVTGDIASAFNSMTRNLRTLIRQVKAVTQKVGGSAMAINETTEQLARGSSAQSSQITRTKTAIANMAVQIQDVSENATLSTRVADESLRNARGGMLAARENISAMNAIRKQVQETAKRIKRLGERSQEISQIVALIDDLSDRTSVLALNASLQATSSDRSAAEFGSVAEEVERLAERSTKLTGQISKLTETINIETKEVVSSMEETIREVTLGSVSAEKAARSLVEIEKVNGELAELLRSISESAAVQAKTSEDVSGAMSDIAQVTELIQISAKKASDSVRTLVQLSGDLQNSVSPFKLPAEIAPEPPGQDMATPRFAN